MSLKKTFLIANTRAGSGKLGRIWASAVEPALRAIMPEFSHAFTERTGHATEIARKALREGFSTIVAMGGDGTINEVVNGFFDDGKPINSDAVLGILPFGSGGDFVRTVGIPRRFQKAAQILANGRVHAIDVGLVRFKESRFAPRHFINIADAGVVAAIMRGVERIPRTLPALSRYLGGTVLGFCNYQNVRVRLAFDGCDAGEYSLTNLVVANGRFFGRGMKPAPQAELDDGWLDVIVLKNTSLARFLVSVLPELYRGKIHAQTSSLHEIRRCHEVSVQVIDSRSKLPIEMDGETHGEGDATFTIMPRAINIVLPASELATQMLLAPVMAG